MNANQNVKRSPQKDPSDWTTGDEPVTGPQASCLKTLARKPRATLMKSLTNAQSSQWIDELQKITGRGAPSKRRRSAKQANQALQPNLKAARKE
jgi:hypothetical protein